MAGKQPAKAPTKLSGPQLGKMAASLTQRANVPLPPASQRISEMRGVSLLAPRSDDEAAALIMWSSDVTKKTLFAPAVLERLARANSMKKSALRLIEAMRCTAQPNRHFRGQRLVPTDVNATSERIDFARALNDFGSCFDNMEPLLNYAREVVDLETQLDQHHEVFLRQVMIFCAKPLQTFVDVNFPTIMKCHAELEKARDKYDAARKKDPAKVIQARAEFLWQAREFAGLLDQLPTFQMVFAKALDAFVRAEGAFGGTLNKMTCAIKQPDHKKRWAVPPM